MNAKTGNNLTDKYLVERVLKGESRAYGIIVKNTEALVAQIVFKMLPVQDDRRDIAQDIYMKVYEHLPGFRFQSKLSTWIAQIAYNTCINYLEKKKLWLPGDWYNESGQHDEEFPGATAQEGNTAFFQEPEQNLILQDRAAILREAMEHLSPLYKTLISLFHQEEMSYAEIMEITGLPEGTLKNYLFRARKSMKNYLMTRYTKEEL